MLLFHLRCAISHPRVRIPLVVAAAALAACKDKGEKAPDPSAGKPTEVAVEKPKASPKPTGTPRPQSKLAVTLDGKPVEMATALAWKHWDGSVKVTVSSVPVGCAEVTGDMRRLHDGEVTFDVGFASTLQPDGSSKPQLRSTYYSGMTAQKGSPATATGDGSPDQPTTIDVDFESTSAGKDEHKLTVKGTIDAIGCAVAPRGGEAPALPPEMPAKITIAGKTFPVRFAKFRKSGDWPVVTLYSGAEGCKQVPFAPPSEVEVELTWFKPEEVGQVSLRGTLLGQSADQTFDKKKLVVKPVPSGAGELELAGDIKVSDFPVKLEGRVTVTECPP